MSRQQITAALAADRPQLQESFAVQPHRPLGPMNELSRTAYQRLLRYVHFTDNQFRDWPLAEGCRFHKEEGDTEFPVRQNADVALGYAVLLTGDYDEKITGVPRDRIQSDLRGLLRYLAITHRANLLPTGTGKSWGEQWQSAFWAATAGHAAWLAWDSLDDDTRIMMARVIAYEADRFNTRPPDSGWKKDTKAEENAWNSEVIALAACMFPHHPHAVVWRERALIYMINSFVREEDRQSGRVVDGRPARDRLQATTLYPDFTLENHNRIHPDYMTTASLMLRNAIFYEAAGQPIPESLFFNVSEMFELVERLSSANGSLFYVNGQDWWPHRHEVLLTLTSNLSVLKNDRKAAFLESATLDSLERMHARFSDGTAWDPREYNYRSAEQELIARYAEMYLLHRLRGEGPAPLTREEFIRAQCGTKVFEAGGFVIHRTPGKFASFAWGNGAMGLVYPSEDTWFTSPSERSMIGRIAVHGIREKQPVVIAHHVQALEDGFAAVVRIERGEGRVEQDAAMISLPGSPVIWLEKLMARQDAEIDEVATGLYAILNEDAGAVHANHRTVYHAGGADDIMGASPAPARWLKWETSWANIDGRFGVLKEGTPSVMAYHDENQYARSRLEEELVPNYRVGVGRVSRGQVFGTCAVAYLPNASVQETSSAQLECASTPEGLLAARLGKQVVAVNLGPAPASGTVFGQQFTLEPLTAEIR